MRTFLVLLFFGIVITAHAQPVPDTLWTRVIGGPEYDIPAVIRVTSDDGYLIAGRRGNAGNPVSEMDAYLVKLDTDGNVQWERRNGSVGNDGFVDVNQTADGGYIAGGGNINNDVHRRLYFVRTGAAGDTLWTRIWDWSRWVDGNTYRIVPCADGGSLATFRLDGVMGSANMHRGLLRLDSAGDSLWARLRPGRLSSDGDEVTYPDMALASDGTILISGSRRTWWRDMNGIYHYTYYWQLFRLNCAGDTLWSVEGSSGQPTGSGQLEPLADGGCLLQLTENVVKRFDSTGTELWSQPFVIPATDLCARPGGGYVLASNDTLGDDDIRLQAYDSTGVLRWERTWGGPGEDRVVAVAATADGGYLILGLTDSFGAGQTDIWMIKTVPDFMLPAAEPRDELLPESCSLSAYPNPFNAQTRLAFELPRAGRAEITLYDLGGRAVHTLTDHVYDAGRHDIAVNADALPSGLYFARLTTPGFTQTQKLLLIK